MPHQLTRLACGTLLVAVACLVASAPGIRAQTPVVASSGLDQILKGLATWDGGIDSAASWKLRDYVRERRDDPAGRAECETALVAYLKSPATPSARLAASRALRAIAGEQAVPALAALLVDDRTSDPAIYALQPIPGPAADKALPELRRLLFRRHGVEDFEVYARYERMREMDQEVKVYDLTFKVIGLISLLVGAIVVANIQLASFRERVREVGVRKAVGAKGWHIGVQFQVESLVVSGIGGALGLLLGVGFVHVIAWLLEQYTVLTPGMIGAAVGCAGTVGVVAGSLPAIYAARLDPVVALRYE